jgi:23S rRNA pseudouridine1911/1915/1917 synthase
LASSDYAAEWPPVSKRFEVTEPGELLKFLIAKLPDRSRSSVKSLLANGMVLVNGETVTQFNHPLALGQEVGIGRAGRAGEGRGGGVNIVFEDAHLAVIDKRADPRNRIFIVHRLDRETSGLMMFAKNPDIQRALQDTWQEAVLERTYAAVVEGRIESPHGTITSWLKEDRSLIMRSSPVPDDGQKAITHYRVLQSTKLYSLVELKLETGRKNQIRVHMQDLGHSIAGDKKYGATRNPIRRLGLHARVLAFRHPVTGKAMRFESPMPPEFARLIPA